MLMLTPYSGEGSIIYVEVGKQLTNLFDTRKKRKTKEIFGAIPRPAELLKLRPLLVPPDLIWQLWRTSGSVTNRQQQHSVLASTRLMDSVSWTAWTRPDSGSPSPRTTVSGGTNPVKGQMIQEEPAEPAEPADWLSSSGSEDLPEPSSCPRAAEDICPPGGRRDRRPATEGWI